MSTADLVPPPPPPSAAAELTTDGAPAGKAIDRDAVRQAMIEAGRTAMGVTGDKPESLRKVFKKHGLSFYPVMALSLLVMVDEFQRTVFTVMGPEIARALGISAQGIGGFLVLSSLSASLAGMPIAALVQKKPRRALVAKITGLFWSSATVLAGFVRGIPAFGALMVADGATSGSTLTVHTALLFDTYPPETRARVLSFHRGANTIGYIIAPSLVALCTGFFLLSWRGVFVVMGLVSLVCAVLAIRLRDPGFGGFDTDRIRRQVHKSVEGEAAVATHDDDIHLGFWEIVRRLWLIPTVRLIFQAYILLGMMVVPMITFLPFVLEERYQLTATGRGIFQALVPFFGLVVLGWAARKAEQLFAEDPRKLMRFAGSMFGAAMASLLIGLAIPHVIGLFIGFGMFNAFINALIPALGLGGGGIIPAQARPHFGALGGILLYGVGGPAALFLFGGIERRFGLIGALVTLSIPAALATLMLLRTSRTVMGDLDRMIGDVVDEQLLLEEAARGVTPPLVALRNVDFSYDKLQVLFDVSFAVQEGEMVALLGTNGAGKSTLLRVLSGLGYPSSGTVRFKGQDITYLDPARRVGLGISQIPGGKAVFRSMTVTENLRAYGFSLGQNRKEVDAGIEKSFEVFPRLAERRNQLAGTMSGGEAQMLGLSKALLLKPKLLCIDELSLGLAPKIVAELLVMVREINEQGTAVVLVEQSVNIALSLVDHAYFMEKGEIRFDGPAKDLLARGDLLRSVFLQGAAAGASGSGNGHAKAGI